LLWCPDRATRTPCLAPFFPAFFQPFSRRSRAFALRSAALSTQILCKTAGGAFTGTLCKAAQVPRGHEKVVKKIDSSANNLTLAAASGDKTPREKPLSYGA